MPGPVEAFFLELPLGRRFCLFYPACGQESARGALLYIHPFAEELNRSRRMAALQARALAAAGYAVLQIDLYGCGDSSGDFGEADWTIWIDDVLRAGVWLRNRVSAPLWLWGLRAGCLVASAAAPRLEALAGFVFWQPMFSGRQCLQQFLRLKIAGDLVDGQAAQGMKALRQQLATGESVEIAGYTLSPALAADLEGAELLLVGQDLRIECLEISSQVGQNPSPVLEKHLRDWRALGHAAHGVVVQGPAIWQTLETTECLALIPATIAALQDDRP